MIEQRASNRFFKFATCYSVYLFISIICSFPLYASEPVQPKDIGLGDYPVAVKYLNQYISYLIDEEDLSGLSVAIVNEKNIVWEKGFGFSDRDLEIPSRPNTVYQAGAITGLLTSALIVRLASEGLLNLEDDIKKHLPDLVVHSRVRSNEIITIRNLLTHHAGLPINVFKHSWAKDPVSFHSLLDSSSKLSASYAPETIYAFSNVGYSLLGLIVERVTKQSFSYAMQKYILTPLKMENSSVDNNSDLVKSIAVGYKNGDVGEKLLPRDTPSVGLLTTAKDLSRFIRLYFEGSASQWRNLTETIRVQNSDIKLDVGRKVGFSWNIDGMNVKNAGSVIWRGGATPFHRSRVAMLPDHKLGVIVLSNDSKSWEVIEKISEKALQLMLEAKTGIKQPEEPKDETQKKAKIIPHKNLIKDGFANAYSGFVGHIKIHSTDSTQTAKILGWNFVLSKDQNNLNWYELKYDLLGFIPIDISWISGVKVRPAIVDKKRVLIVYYKGRQYLFAQDFKPEKVHETWKTLLGEYQVQNSDSLLESMKVKSGELVLNDGDLFFVYRLPFWFGIDIEIPIKTLSNSEAIIPGLGTGLNETIYVEKVDGKFELEYSGYKLEKVTDTEIFSF